MYKVNCHKIFIAIMFHFWNTRKLEIRKSPKCPSSDEWMKTTWYIYKMEYYSVI